PPLFQFLVGGWYALFGFSLRSSLAFSFTVHLLSALVLLALADRYLCHCYHHSHQWNGSQHEPSGLQGPWRVRRRVLLLALGLIHLANLSNFDRQEETALLFLWLELLLVAGYPGAVCSPKINSTGLGCLLSGLCIAAAGMISPWVGLLGACAYALRELFVEWFAPAGGLPVPSGVGHLLLRLGRWLGRGLLAGVTAFVPVAFWVWYLESHYPGILNDQFFGTLRYLAEHRPRQPTFLNNLEEFWNSLLLNKAQLPLLLVVLLSYPRQPRVAHTPALLALYITGLVGLVFLLVLRPEGYTYLGAVLLLWMPVLVPALTQYLVEPSVPARQFYPLLLVLVLFAQVKLIDQVTLPWRWTERERPDVVAARLQAIIPPGELVGTTGRHWAFFQVRNPWLEAAFILDKPVLLEARWMVIRVGIGLPPCIEAFEQVEEIPSAQHRDNTYAYSLWRRRAGEAGDARPDVGKAGP
ncbi:MAG TPA: hypothetical protein PKA06_07210, partial [Gemmatales bacterium]|nr:hypothetical protein [Gemmatales bacterium]